MFRFGDSVLFSSKLIGIFDPPDGAIRHGMIFQTKSPTQMKSFLRVTGYSHRWNHQGSHSALLLVREELLLTGDRNMADLSQKWPLELLLCLNSWL